MVNFYGNYFPGRIMKMTMLLLLAVGTGVSYANVSPSRNENAVLVDEDQSQRVLIKGIVRDPDGEPLAGVTVAPASGAASISGANGEYSVYVRNMSESLTFIYIGMENQTIELKEGTTQYDVTMDYAAERIEAVVVEAGIIQRDKMGFTGSFTQISGEDLKMSGNINVVQSLKSIDPAFVVADNAMRGSDPNAMANISLRGGSAMNVTSTFNDYSVNPNQPLFILDGTETSIQVISDMDINRIESITILKDAGSTAIYGSRGGNGVVIVETVKPKAGQLRLAYNGNLILSAADLSVYNLMNASEKLTFERMAGRYGDLNDWVNNSSAIKSYNTRLENIMQGVDTYWLKVPLRTGITHDHSLNIDGGEGGMLYQVGVQYRDVEGVMKGSSRETFGGNIRLQYRPNSTLNVVNNLTVSATNSYEDSFAREGFTEFVKANPYFRMLNPDGTIPSYLDTEYVSAAGAGGRYDASGGNFANPYYNAMLDSRNDSKTLLVSNNTVVDWYILPKLRWTNTLVLSTTRINGEAVHDPRDTAYDGKDFKTIGSYTSSNSRDWRYDASTRLAYSVTIDDSHNITFNGRAAIQSMQLNGDGYTVTGFPKGVPVRPSYAYDYVENSRPTYTETVLREANFLAALSYNYKLRYLFDFNLSNDGSTAFGRNNKFQSFWSAGLGWNVDQEEFAKNWTWLNNLKIRGSYGINGNQNVSNISSNIYKYYAGNDIFGAAAYLSQFANPDLRWQLVAKSSAGFDLTALKNRLNVTFDLFRQNTDPQVVNIQQKPSSGVSSYPVNLGYLRTDGLEFMVSYQVIRDMARDISLTVRVNGMAKKSEYGGFEDALNNLNNSYKSETDSSGRTIDAKINPNSLVQYRDGNSPDALWAVRSLGIDPATGREVFLDRFGSPTFTYSVDDRVPIASRNPDLMGVVGFTLRVKNLTANFNFRYSFGGYEFNQDLFTKVENINSTTVAHNQDRRALYDRWAKPGDVAKFKAIQMITLDANNTPISSRFIQRNNYFSGESARLSYSFTGKEWLKSAGVDYLTLNLSYTDLFYLSTMKRERSTQYPFARTVSFGLSAQF